MEGFDPEGILPWLIGLAFVALFVIAFALGAGFLWFLLTLANSV